MSKFLERLQDSLMDLGTHEELESLVLKVFGAHPFTAAISPAVLEELLPDYLGMSQGFRYVIAAAQKDVFFEAMAKNRGVPPEVEMMNAVANFLVWDETGGVDLLSCAEGKHKLPQILDLDRLHSDLLRVDAEKLLGHAVAPRFRPATRHYLTELYRGLGSSDPVVRCAHMVAFELHAGAMIDSLWASIARVTTLAREELRYFALHVGGDDPAEVYHVQMTQRLIERVVQPADRVRFRQSFLAAYALHVEWCRALVEGTSARPDHDAGEVWHEGSCHCGGVTFKVLAPAVLNVVRCNCSICDMSGFMSLIVPAAKFELVTGEDLLTTYRFNTQRATHTFCGKCGHKAFYRPRSHPDSISVNVRCLNRAKVAGVEVRDFDGQNWEKSIGELVA